MPASFVLPADWSKRMRYQLLNQSETLLERSYVILEVGESKYLEHDSDWLPKYKCDIIIQSEKLLERQYTSGVSAMDIAN